MTFHDSSPYPCAARVAPSLPTDGLVSKVLPPLTTPCHNALSNESRRQRRKSVTFSLVTQVVSASEVPGMNKSRPSADATLHDSTLIYEKSIFGDSTNASRNVISPSVITQSDNGGSSKKDERNATSANAPPSRKRRFSLVSQPVVELHISSPNEVAATAEFPSSPRKRRLSSLPPYEDDPSHISSQPQPGVRNSLLPNPPRHTKLTILPSPTDQPPPEICAEVNHRIKTAFGHPSFDFSQHVSHRTYVVRSFAFSPSEECVSMLDIGVDGLLPTMFPQSPPCADDNFMIHQSPGQGLGMFARRLIRSGEIVVVERPVVLTPYVIGLALPLEQLYFDLFKKLSPCVSKQLMDLSFSSVSLDRSKRANVESQTREICESIMRMNALAVQLQVPKGENAELSTHRGVFLQTSRCNHSCAPNAKWDWDQDTFSLVLTSVRAIKPTEEITIGYVSPHLPSHERQSRLRKLHSFQCMCSICTQPAEAVLRSDLARLRLAAFWDRNHGVPSFKEWCEDRNGVFGDQMLLDLHLWAVETIEAEGMEILDCPSSSVASVFSGPLSSSSSSHPWRDLGRHIDVITMCYGALADVKNFKEWVLRAADARELERPEQRLAFKKWVSNPMAFPAWGLRKKIGN